MLRIPGEEITVVIGDRPHQCNVRTFMRYDPVAKSQSRIRRSNSQAAFEKVSGVREREYIALIDPYAVCVCDLISTLIAYNYQFAIDHTSDILICTVVQCADIHVLRISSEESVVHRVLEFEGGV